MAKPDGAAPVPVAKRMVEEDDVVAVESLISGLDTHHVRLGELS